MRLFEKNLLWGLCPMFWASVYYTLSLASVDFYLIYSSCLYLRLLSLRPCSDMSKRSILITVADLACLVLHLYSYSIKPLTLRKCCFLPYYVFSRTLNSPIIMSGSMMTYSAEPSSPLNGGVRKRVCQVCDRCRLKKSKVRLPDLF